MSKQIVPWTEIIKAQQKAIAAKETKKYNFEGNNENHTKITNLAIAMLTREKNFHTNRSARLESLILNFNNKLRSKRPEAIKKIIHLWLNQ
jgi:hypothetical protein